MYTNFMDKGIKKMIRFQFILVTEVHVKHAVFFSLIQTREQNNINEFNNKIK